MNYGNNHVNFANLALNETASITNIGDWVQILAIDNIYNKMEVNLRNVVRIPVDKISSYRGEKLILPINFPMFGIYDLSPDIIPVFLGLSVVHNSVARGLRLKQYEPVGCRDAHTFRELSSVGIECYHGGCLSITFSKREAEPKAGNIYLIGISDSVYDNLPVEIKREGIRNDHVVIGNTINYSTTKAILHNYKNDAKLVVTSKIHCAQPCIAMGIPVVFICENYSFRYEVISRYVPLYSKMDLISRRINWNTSAIEIEEEKKILVENAISRIKETYKSFVLNTKAETNVSLIKEVDKIYSPKEQSQSKYELDVISEFVRYIARKYSENDEFAYAIWGVTQFAYAAYDEIKTRYPLSKLEMVIDKKNRKPFHGIIPVPSSELKGYDNVVMFAAPSAVGEAFNEFKKLDVKQYFVCYGGVHIEDGVVIEYPYDEE